MCLYGSEGEVRIEKQCGMTLIYVCEGRGTEGVKSAPDRTLGFLVRPCFLWLQWLVRVLWFGN